MMNTNQDDNNSSNNNNNDNKIDNIEKGEQSNPSININTKTQNKNSISIPRIVTNNDYTDVNNNNADTTQNSPADSTSRTLVPLTSTSRTLTPTTPTPTLDNSLTHLSPTATINGEIKIDNENNHKNDNDIIIKQFDNSDDVRHKRKKSNDNNSNNNNNKNNNDNDNNYRGRSFSNVVPFQNPFPFTPSLLSRLFDPKNIKLLNFLGGTDGIIKGLHTDISTGLSSDETAQLDPIPLDSIIDKENKDKIIVTESPPTIIKTAQQLAETPFYQRKAAFGTNVLPERKPKSILQLMWMALQEKILILLTIAAIVSLGLGLYEDFSQNAPQKIKWVEGVAIIVAILIVVLVGSINDWQKERQFRKLNAKKEDRYVKATRDGKEILLSVHKILVGDVLHLEPGDIIAADGVLVSSHNLQCDESAATGESDSVKKIKYDDIKDQSLHDDDSKTTSDNHHYHHHGRHQNADPFIISGSKVIEGVGTYVVTGVGENSFHGRTMMSLRTESEDTPLQIKLNDLAEKIAKLGGAAALFMLIVLLIKYFAFTFHRDSGSTAKVLESLTRIIISTVTIVVVAVPEGLPLAVTLALAYATTRMLKDNNLVRVLSACETMGNATIVCSDKTGTLTQNKMTVVVGIIGLSKSFARDIEVYNVTTLKKNTSSRGKKIPIILENPVTLKDLRNELSSETLKLLEDSIAINSTAFEGERTEDGKINFIGSKTDTALLSFLFDLNLENYKFLRESAKIQQLYPFSSERKAMGVVVKLSDDKYRFLLKGASEVLLKNATKTIKPAGESHNNSDNDAMITTNTIVDVLTDEDRKTLNGVIEHYASQSLRTITIAYRDFNQWPPQKHVAINGDEEDEVTFEELAKNLTLISIVGIEDPLRDGVRDAVSDCRKAGVKVCMVTGDNLLTAKSIATQCGIYSNGTVMEGPTFRNLSPEEMNNVIPRLQVLARSSPEDKRILVSHLREMGEVVAVTGDGTNDGPALKTADVGFSMGISGTEVAKEASSIILMDDNFASIVKAIIWGRCVNDSVKKFLQFQLTVNVTAVILTFVSAVSDDEERSVLTAVQLLWVNLIMDTLAALALATDPPTPQLLNRHPEPKNAPLITFDMWKMILGQSVFQLALMFVLLYAGNDILSYDTPEESSKLQTVIFNTFVFLQIFNEINCRRLDHKLNVFKNMFSNNFLIIIFFTTVIGQILIVEFGGQAFQTESLNIYEWLLCVILGLTSIPVGVVIRLIPNEFFCCCYTSPDVTASVATINRNSMYSVTGLGDDQKEWSDAVLKVQNQLRVFKTLRGGRFRAHFGDRKVMRVTRSNAFAAATMVPSLVSASVGAGWAPIMVGRNIVDSNGNSRNNSRNPSITQLDSTIAAIRSRHQSLHESVNGSSRNNTDSIYDIV